MNSRDAARALRRNQTSAERALWARLRRRGVAGFRFRRQVVIGKFIADFYCPGARLVIEVDGGIHQTDAQRLRDRERDEALTSEGFCVLRVTNEDVLERLNSVLDRIQDAAQAAAPQWKAPE